MATQMNRTLLPVTVIATLMTSKVVPLIVLALEFESPSSIPLPPPPVPLSIPISFLLLHLLFLLGVLIPYLLMLLIVNV